jgi:hypothetical protein
MQIWIHLTDASSKERHEKYNLAVCLMYVTQHGRKLYWQNWWHLYSDNYSKYCRRPSRYFLTYVSGSDEEKLTSFNNNDESDKCANEDEESKRNFCAPISYLYFGEYYTGGMGIASMAFWAQHCNTEHTGVVFSEQSTESLCSDLMKDFFRYKKKKIMYEAMWEMKWQRKFQPCPLFQEDFDYLPCLLSYSFIV